MQRILMALTLVLSLTVMFIVPTWATEEAINSQNLERILQSLEASKGKKDNTPKDVSKAAKDEEEKVKPDDPSEVYRLMALYVQILNIASREYYKEVSQEDMIKAAINGALMSLDPYSGFLDVKDFKSMQERTSGEFGGVGMQVMLDDTGYVKVIAAIDNTPAKKAGILPNDIIIKINDDDILGKSLEDAVDMLKGQPKTQVKITIVRKGKRPFDITLTRAKIRTQPVTVKLEDDDILYIRIPSFDSQVEAEMQKGIKEVRKNATIKGIILDVRGNPGGLLEQSIMVSNAFLKEGEIVSIRPRNVEDIQRFNAQNNPETISDIPMVVLIDQGSASASEIVAGALQDQKRATLIGAKTFGKGSVQTVAQLGQKQQGIRLTIALYYTPSGRTIHKKGVEPDIYVSVNGQSCILEKCTNEEKKKIQDDYMDTEDKTPEEIEKLPDVQLQYALALLKGKAPPKPIVKKDDKKEEKKDETKK